MTVPARSRSPRRLFKQIFFMLALSLAAATAVPIVAQHGDDVPIPGVTGTIGLDGTIDKFYGVTHGAIVKTADGVRHLVHLTSHTTVHGARSADDAFASLEEGSRVVVHYVMEDDKKTAVEIDRVSDDGLTLLEGTVKRVDRKGKKLTLQLADDSVVTLRLTDRAARDVGRMSNAKAGRLSTMPTRVRTGRTLLRKVCTN